MFIEVERCNEFEVTNVTTLEEAKNVFGAGFGHVAWKTVSCISRGPRDLVSMRMIGGLQWESLNVGSMLNSSQLKVGYYECSQRKGRSRQDA